MHPRGGLHLDRGFIVLTFLLGWFTGCTRTDQENLPDDYIPFTLSFSDSGLVGSSEFLQGFTISMGIQREDLPAAIDPGSLVSAVRHRPRTGTLTYPNGRTTGIEFEVVRHRGPEEIYMKTSLGYFLWEHVSGTDDQVHLAIYCLVPDHGFAHTLMDYNNAQTTRYADILHILALARERVEAELFP